MLKAHGLRLAAIENFSPNSWSDILLDGPKKREQMEDLKRLVRDADKAGVPIIGYNFSIVGVWMDEEAHRSRRRHDHQL